MLEESGGIIIDKKNLLNPILSLDITKLEEYNPILDIYEQLACIKLLDKDANLSHFKAVYSEPIKQLMTQKGAIKDTITDSARVLLILELLDLKKTEFNMCQKLLNYIISTTNFFNLENVNKDWNWQIDKLGYTVELRMLFWALLASSQYSPIIV